MKTTTFLAMLMLATSVAVANAQEPAKEQQPVQQNANCKSFVDENKNGVCDNYEKGTCPYPNRQFYGKGRRNMPQRHAMTPEMRQGRRNINRDAAERRAAVMQRRGFKDDNNNGICDYYEEWQKSQQNTASEKK